MSKETIIKKELEIAANNLSNQIGFHVGAAYGYPNKIKGTPENFLIIWSNIKVKAPKTFEGFTVVIRGIPKPL